MLYVNPSQTGHVSFFLAAVFRDLATNQLNGSIDELCRLPSLARLYAKSPQQIPLL